MIDVGNSMLGSAGAGAGRVTAVPYLAMDLKLLNASHDACCCTAGSA